MTRVINSIDVNADLGEGFPNDARLLDLVTSASVSCGAHAGDEATIRSTLEAAKERGVPVGAHPGYPDREGFGRRERPLASTDVASLIVEQVNGLRKIAHVSGISVSFVKPHGALYNQAQQDDSIAGGVVDALLLLDLPLLGQPGTVLERTAVDRKLRFVPEGFPERRYDSEGRLVARSQPDAVLKSPEEIEAQVGRLVERGIATLCIHGDDRHAVEKAEIVLGALERRGITARFWG